MRLGELRRSGVFDDLVSKTIDMAGLVEMLKGRGRPPEFPKANNGPIPDKYKLMPVPQRALDLNPKLTQNPGW